MTALSPLPPGQRDIGAFPRFGITRFAQRFPAEPACIALTIGGNVAGNVAHQVVWRGVLDGLTRVEQVSDFHCVTTWSHRGLRWGGVRFAEFYQRVVLKEARPLPGATLVALRGQDGACTALPLEDLLAPDVLLADTLDGQPLTIAHGAPLRLIAPAHYGYKSVKHLSRIEFAHPAAGYRVSAYAFMDHPRARVAQEERGRGAPGWLLRHLYRPLISVTVARFARALAEREQEQA